MYHNTDIDYDENLNLTNDELECKLKKYVELQKDIARLKGAPTAEYDKVKGKSYLLYPDGRKVYNE